MGQSLQDQLLQAGIARPKQAKKARKDKTRQRKAARQAGHTETPEERQRKQDAAAAEAGKRAADRRRAEAENAERARRERKAQAIQIIRQRRIAIEPPADEDEPPYSYTIKGRIRGLPVSRAQRALLASGQLGIVRYDGETSLVDRATAERLEGLIPKAVWRICERDDTPDPDDPYAAYTVPDDLMW